MRAVIDYLDKRRSGGGAGWRASATAALRPWSHDPAGLWPAGDDRRLCALRSGRRARCSRSCDSRRMDCLAQDGDEWLDAAANARLDQECRGTITGSCITARPRAGTCATPTCSRRSAQLLDAQRAGVEGGGLGAQQPYRRRRALPRWAWPASELNIGQLVKERFGDEARLIGFGTHAGTVAAATDWDAPMEVKHVRPVAAGELRAAVPRQRRRRASCSTCARGRTDRSRVS